MLGEPISSPEPLDQILYSLPLQQLAAALEEAALAAMAARVVVQYSVAAALSLEALDHKAITAARTVLLLLTFPVGVGVALVRLVQMVQFRG